MLNKLGFWQFYVILRGGLRNRFGRSGGCRTNNQQLKTRLTGSALALPVYELLPNQSKFASAAMPYVIVVHLCGYSGSVNSELRTIYIMLLVCHSRSPCFGSSACQNLTPRNPDLLTSLLLWGYACYYCCMPSSPSCLAAYKYTVLIPCVAYTALVSLLFGTVVPTSFNLLMEMFLLPYIHCSTCHV